MKHILIIFLIFEIISFSLKAQYPGCPQIDLGPDLSTSCSDPCVNLSATVLQTGQTDSYTVTSIPYAPPFPFSGGTPVSVNVDDVYSPVISLPFNFCFYGQSYNQVIVGSNGNISFDLTNASGYCPWSFTASIPSNTLPVNSIFGAYFDIDPGVCGNVYYDITGNYPCRTFVFKFDGVCYFSCNSLVTSQEIVLYEGTNVVEVYIQDHPVCSTWNSGNAVIGMQNATGTVGITPPGYNTGPWTSNNIAWRFTPSGPPNYQINWYDEFGALVSTGLTASVCPTVTTTYTGQVIYNNCNGANINAFDQVTVSVSFSSYAGADDTTCSLSYPLSATSSSGTGTWTASGPGTSNFSNINDTNAVVTVSNSGIYSFIWTTGTGGTQCSDTVLINFSQLPVANAGPDASVCSLSYQMNAVPSTGTGTWTYSGPDTISFSNVNSPITNVTASSGGNYTFIWTESNSANCTSSDTVLVTLTQMPVADAGADITLCQLSTNLAGIASVGTGTWTLTSGTGLNIANINSSTSGISTTNTSGTYTLTWTEDNGNGCVSSDMVDVILAQNPVAQAGVDNSVCLLSYQLQAVPSVGNGVWSFAGPGTANFVNSSDPTTNVTVSVEGTYTFTWTEDNGFSCVSSDYVDIIFTVQPVANAGSDISVCQMGTTLQGIPSVGTGTWTQQSGPGIINFNSINSATTTITGSIQGTYTLQWEENNGNGCISNDQMTVVLTQQPVANAGTDSAICNLNYIMTGIPSYGAGTWLEISGTGTSVFSNIYSPSSQVTVSQYGQYTFVWNENNGNGCISNDTVVITFNYIPSSTFGFTEILCFGDNSQINYSGDGLSGAAYNWNFGTANVISGSGQGPYVINYPSDGTFPVTLQVTQNNCVSTVTSENLNNPPALSLSISKTDVTCFGANNGIVSSTVGGGTFPYNYLWSDGSVFSIISTAVAGTYILTVTDVNGCQISDTTLLVEPPQLAIDVPDYIPICNDSVITIDASATGGTFPYTYQWNSGPVTSYITVSPDTTTNYIVTATDSKGCTSVSNIEVYVYPPLVFSASSDVDSICLGEKMIISTIVSGGDGGPYSYTINGIQGSTPFILYPNTSQSYQIIVRDGCQYFSMDTVPVFVYPNPPINFSSDIISGCTPLTVQFNESSPDENQTYLWEFSDNEAAFVKNPVHVFNQPGIFDVNLTVTNIYGCKVSNLYTDFITAYPLPHAQFEANPPIAEIIKPFISFTNFSTLTDSVMWYFGDGDSSNIFNPTHQYQSYPAGLYDVTLIVISPLGCRDTVQGKVEIKDVFTFYAPTAFSPDNDGKNEVFIVSGSGIKEDTFHMLIYDRWGEEIFESTDINQGWDGRVKGGQKATIGVYTWLVTFRDFKKILHERSGSVTIMR